MSVLEKCGNERVKENLYSWTHENYTNKETKCVHLGRYNVSEI